MTDKQIIINVSKCEWRTGVEHCGDYECMLNKCCDYNCDWYKRRKLEQQLDQLKAECEKSKQTLTEIKECLTKNAEKGWVSTSEIDDILQKCKVLDKD